MMGVLNIHSPVYDLNPTPTDVRARVLTTSISLDDATCSIDLALGQAPDIMAPLYVLSAK